MDDIALEDFLTHNTMNIFSPLDAYKSVGGPVKTQETLVGKGSGGEVAGEPTAPQPAKPLGPSLSKKES